MNESKRLDTIVASLKLPRAPSQSVVQGISSRGQGDLFSADTAWFPVLRALIRTGTMARLGPFGIAAYLALKARADLGNGKAAVSIGTVARDTGMCVRAAREAVRKLELEGLVVPDPIVGRRTVYQLVERVQIVDSTGRHVGAAEWPFSSTTWSDHLKKVVAAAIEQLASSGTQTTINIGSINVLVVPDRGGDST